MTNGIGKLGDIRALLSKPEARKSSSQAQEALKPISDSIKLSKPSPSLIEADLGIALTDGSSATVNGKVRLSRTLIERIIRYSINDQSQVINPKIAFDAQKGSYQIQAKYVWHGIKIPFSAELSGVEEANKVGFKIDSLRLPIGKGSISLNRFKGFVTKEFSKQLTQHHFTNEANLKKGILGLDMNNLLAQTAVLPSYLKIDTSKTRFSLETLSSGDIAIHLQTEKPLALPTDTPESDLTIQADQATVTELLKHALAPDYTVNAVTLRQGRVTIEGNGVSQDASDVVNALKLLLSIVGNVKGLPVGGIIGTDPTKVRVPLDLDVTVKDGDLLITPSLTMALSSVDDSLKKAGIPSTRDGDSLKISLNTLLEGKGKIEKINFSSDNLQTQLRFNADSVISDPILNGTQSTEGN